MFGDKCCDQFEQVIVEELFFLQLGTKYYGRDKTFFSCSCSKNRTMLCMLKGVFIIKQWWGIFVNFITKSAPPPFFSITLKKMIDFSIYYYCYEVLNCGFFSQMSPKWVMVAIAAKLSVNNEWSQQVTWYCTCAWMDVGGGALCGKNPTTSHPYIISTLYIASLILSTIISTPSERGGGWKNMGGDPDRGRGGHGMPFKQKIQPSLHIPAQ